MTELFSKKLKMARRMRMLSMDDLVALTDCTLSKQSISKYERGLMMPKPQTLLILAKALRIPVDYFSKPTICLSRMNYRTKGEINDAMRESISAIAHDIIERYTQIEKILDSCPSFTNPLQRVSATTFAETEAAASILRSKWQLGTHPIPSVCHLLETFGIMIIEHHIDSNEFLGFSAFINGARPVILINSANHTVERKRFTILHELAHLLLFSGRKPKEYAEPEEKLCERFASAVLCPAPVLASELGERRSTFTLSELINIRQKYGISIAAIIHRCHDTGIISADYYNHVYDNYINHNRMETGWGAYPIPEDTARRHRLLKHAIAEQIITKDEALELGYIEGAKNSPEVIWN